MTPKLITHAEAEALLDSFAEQSDGDYRPRGVWYARRDIYPRCWTLIDNREGKCEMSIHTALREMYKLKLFRGAGGTQ